MGKYYLGTGNNNQINFQVVDSTGVINDLNLSGLYLSATGKAADADKLDNYDSSYFRDASNLTGVYTGQISGGGIGNADTLDGYDSSYFLNASNITGTLGLNATGSHYISGSLAVDTSTLFVDAVNDRVGIGTTSPSKLLTIGSSTTVNPTVRINSSLTAGSDTSMYSFGIDDTTDFAGMRLDYTDRVAKGLEFFTAAGYGYPISFSTSGASQAMFISYDGKVGIGFEINHRDVLAAVGIELVRRADIEVES